MGFVFRCRLHVRTKRINRIGAPIWEESKCCGKRDFHNEGIALVPEYLTFLKEIGVDNIAVGDPGVVQITEES